MQPSPQINLTNSQLLNYTFNTTEEATQCASRLQDATVENCTVTVPWDYDTAAIMAAYGYKFASPILDPRQYTFPGRNTPFEHQLTLANELSIHRRYYMLCEMGTGKTAASIYAARYLMQIGVVKKVLIVCPLSIVRETWLNSLTELCIDQPATILHHTNPKKRLALAQLPTAWKIVNYDGLKSLNESLVSQKFDLIIIDELRTYADPQTARWKALKNLITRETRVWGLSGTPRPKSCLDVFGQIKLLTPDNITSSFVKFRDQTMVKSSWSAFTWEERPTANALIAKMMQPGRVLKKTDVLKSLPPVAYQYRYVPLSAQQQAFYKALATKSTVGEGMTEITAVNAAVLSSKLIQVAAGACYTPEGDYLQFDNKARVAELLSIIEESIASVLVFCPFVHIVKTLQPILEPLGFDTITGETKDRAEIFARLQSGKSRGILAIPSVMSHGVTATMASCIVWFAPNDSSEVFIQACARADRPGQKNPVTIVALYGSAIERERYLSLQSQREAQHNYLTEFNKFTEEFA